MKTFNQLKKNLKLDFSVHKKIKIALLGDSSTQFLNIALRGLAYDSNLDLNILESDFNQIEYQIFDEKSDFHLFKPEIVIVFHSSHILLNKYNKLDLESKFKLADDRLDLISVLSTKTQEIGAKFIYFNYSEIDDSVYGNFANKLEHSFLFQIRKLNYELMNFSNENSNFHILDLSTIQNSIGKKNLFQPSIYINSEMVLSLESLPLIAHKTIRLIEAISSNIKKCLILDLDNTMWGGIIGDDGIENIQLGTLGIGKAFVEFQYWIKKLKDRGIIIAVCSKNTESIAKTPFESHPDMVLGLDDISVFVANWENKADNIRYIQEVLNIGFDSMVFLDDNPFERNIVRENLPQVAVPELPEDPADYLEFLYGLNLFETINFSAADLERTKQYQVESERVRVKKSFVNEKDYLKSLNMISKIESLSKFNVPRVAQLSQRSNQFNLRTVRYSESDLNALISNENFYVFTFNLEDKFGDNGLICVIILEARNKTLFINSWFMSCRVLKRGMEEFVLKFIVKFATDNGFDEVVGEYIQTPKNSLVKDHFKNLSFKKDDDYWSLKLSDYKSKECFIKLVADE